MTTSIYRRETVGESAARKPIQEFDDLEKEASTIVENHFKEVRGQQIVPPRFKQVVYQTIDWLLGLKCHLSALNKIYLFEDPKKIEESKDKIAHVVSPSLKKSLPPVFNALAESLQGVSGNVQKASMEYLRTKLKQLIYQGDAPDKITSNRTNKKSAMGRHSQHLLSDCLRLYFTEELAANAVEDRAEYLLRQLSHLHVKMHAEHIRVLFLGARSVDELMNLIDGHAELHNAPFEFHVIDPSEVDLKRLENRFNTFNQLNKANFKFQSQKMSFKNLQESLNVGSQQFDLIYTAGEMDYLESDSAKKIATILYALLNDQGRVIVGVYSLSDPSHLTMSIALDWELLFRTNDDFKVMLGEVGRKFAIERQGLTANVFCIIKK